MHDRWLHNFPDELTDEMLAEIDDPEHREAIAEGFRKLKNLDAANWRRKKELFEKHQIMLQDSSDLTIRFNLLVSMFIGEMSPERLAYELQWQQEVSAGCERAYSQYMEQKKAKTLHLPGGKNIQIPGEVPMDQGPNSEPSFPMKVLAVIMILAVFVAFVLPILIGISLNLWEYATG